ncbi:MAG: hypothetical protein RSA22_09095 [Acinetobacter sp.]
MATDVDVQYFSHLNGLVLGNNWGDLIRLLDKALVTGIDFTQITAASIDAQGDVSITLFAAHNAMLFQVVELSGFAPNSLNQKYRIKGVPNTTQLILKPALDITERSITTMGTGKLASLGYDIIFRDANDVKRVYRAKNPTAQHPFIRVDESLASPDGSSGIYDQSYAKYAIVGLLEHIDHIDDFNNPEVRQIPFDPSDPAKNWKIIGTGSNVIRGWSRWYYAARGGTNDYFTDVTSPVLTGRNFTLCGDADAFYLLPAALNQVQKQLMGCGLFENTIGETSSWFLMSYLDQTIAGTSRQFNTVSGGCPLTVGGVGVNFFLSKISLFNKSHVIASGLLPDNFSGYSAPYMSTNTPALDIPLFDSDKYLRGGLKHIKYMGKSIGSSHTTIEISDTSMYVKDNVRQATNNQSANTCGFYFYMGELE